MQHLGAAKTWYGVPADGADGFEEAVMAQIAKHSKVPMTREQLRKEALNLLLGKAAVFSPKLLLDAGELNNCRILSGADVVRDYPLFLYM